MEVLVPSYGLVIWSYHVFFHFLLFLTVVIHLLVTKKVIRQEVPMWAMASLFVPLFGSILYFRFITKKESLK